MNLSRGRLMWRLEKHCFIIILFSYEFRFIFIMSVSCDFRVLQFFAVSVHHIPVITFMLEV